MSTLKKMFKNKRGDDMLVDFWAIAVFAVILLLFFILFSINKTVNDNKVQAEFINKDVNLMLTSFLRAPAIGVDNTKTVGDIITQDSTKGDFSNTEKLFDAYFAYVNDLNGFKVNSIVLDVKGPTNGGASSSGNGQFGRRAIMAWRELWTSNVGKTAVYSSDTYIPGYENKIYVKLSLTEYILVKEIKAQAAADKAKQNGK